MVVPMVTDRLTDRLDSEPILSIGVNLRVNLTETGMATVRDVNGPLHTHFYRFPCTSLGSCLVTQGP